MECTKSELDLFYVPPTNTSIESGQWTAYYPTTSPLINSGPIEFEVKATNEYVHLCKTLLYLNVRFNVHQVAVKIDGSDSTAAETEFSKKFKDSSFGPVNNLASSLFSQVDIELNGTSIETTNDTYPYKAYICDLLNYGQDAKSTFLQTSLFYKDTPGQMDSIEITGDKINEGLINRRKIIEDGKGKLELITRLYNDFFNTDRYLLNGVNMKVSLKRHKPEFFLMKKDLANVDMIIENAVLYVRRAKISPQVLLAHSMALEKVSAKYPIKRVTISHYAINKDVLEYKTPSLITTVLPQRVIVGMVDHLAFNGSFTLNPFNFQHYNLSKLELATETGNIIYPNGLEFDFPGQRYLRGYYSMFEGIDKPVFMTGNDISRLDYSKGYALFCFDLTPDLCSGDHVNLKKSSQLILNLNFKETRQSAVNLIVFMEFENMIEINSARAILCDYK